MIVELDPSMSSKLRHEQQLPTPECGNILVTWVCLVVYERLQLASVLQPRCGPSIVDHLQLSVLSFLS